jgi:hypothetical protein
MRGRPDIIKIKKDKHQSSNGEKQEPKNQLFNKRNIKSKHDKRFIRQNYESFLVDGASFKKGNSI